MFLFDGGGRLAYRGAVDDSHIPDINPHDLEGIASEKLAKR